jgi:hypothetical protein
LQLTKATFTKDVSYNEESGFTALNLQSPIWEGQYYLIIDAVFEGQYFSTYPTQFTDSNDHIVLSTQVLFKDYSSNLRPDPSLPISCNNPYSWKEDRPARTETTKSYYIPREVSIHCLPVSTIKTATYLNTSLFFYRQDSLL